MSGHAGGKAGLQTQAEAILHMIRERAPGSSNYTLPQSSVGPSVHSGSFLPHSRGQGRACLVLAQPQ